MAAGDLPFPMNLKKDAAHRLARIAAMLELLGEDPFRVSANAKAARTLDAYPGPIDDNADAKALTKIPGIGPKIAAKIIELRDTGHIEEETQLAARVPQSLLELLEIPGLGPKSVRLLWENLKVQTLDDLRRVIDDGSILELPRMGQKTVDNIRTALAFMSTSSERLPLGVATAIAEALANHLHPAATEVALAGSLRRGRDTLGDIDLLAASTDPEAVVQRFVTAPGVLAVLAQGPTRASVRVRVPEVARGKRRSAAREIQADLRVVEPESWGAALLYFTGSKDHGVALRKRALKAGSTLNEYGLFPNDDHDTPPQERGIPPLAARTEADIYKALNLPWIPPEIREDHGELDLTETPRLIELADIKAELHAHTVASDGRLTLDELVEHAIRRGFHTIAVTDHSRSSTQANGLTVERLREQRGHIETAREKYAGQITILHGSEVDIHADGRLDFDDDTLAWLDLVVASPHGALAQTPTVATGRLLKAIAHPLVHILGHPTGRLINKRAGLDPAIDELAAAAREHNTALEINAHWQRLDLRGEHARIATAAGARIAIDCDVHYDTDFDNLRFGVATARRGWVTPANCINAMDNKSLLKWLRSKRA